MMTSQVSSRSGNTVLAAKNSSFSLFSLGCRLVGNMIIFVIIARLPSITTTEFGQLTFSVALGSIFVLFSQFGIPPLFVRDIAKNRSLLKVYAPSVFTLRIILSLLSYSLMLTYVDQIDLSDQARIVFYIMTASLFIGSFSLDFQSIFQSHERLELEIFGIAIENGFLLTMGLVAFWFAPNIVQISCIFLAAKFIALIVNYFICGRLFIWVSIQLDWKLWKKLLVDALPFCLAGIIATGIVHLDTIMIREFSTADPDAAVGVYQAAVRLFLVPMLLPEIVIRVFLPQLSRMDIFDDSKLIKNLGSVNNILLTLGMLIGLATVVRGADIIQLFYGDKYIDAGPLLQVLGFSIMLRFGAAYNLYFTIRNRVWFRVLSGLLALSAVVLFNYIFIPIFGPLGAAYASVLAHLVYWVPFLTTLFYAEKTVLLGWNIGGALCIGFLYLALLFATASISLFYMFPVYVVFALMSVFFILPSIDRQRLITLRYRH